MTTYNTGHPLGSTDARDLYDNAENLDHAVNGELPTFTDRLGAVRMSYAGIEQQADQVITQAEQAILDSLSTIGSGGLPGAKFAQRIEADGVSTVYSLTTTPLSTLQTDVYINGVYQQKNSYTLAGTSPVTLVFSEAPPAPMVPGERNIEVIVSEAVMIGEDGLRTDLASPIGSSLVGFQPESAPPTDVQTALRALAGESKYNRRVACVLPQRPPNYAEIVSTYGYNYIYQQDFCIDEIANEVWVAFSPNGGANTWGWVAVFDWPSGDFKRIFSAGVGISEGIAIDYEGANRFLYVKDSGTGSAGIIGKYNVTTLPASLARITAASTLDVGLYFQFSIDGDSLFVETSRTPIGTFNRRTVFAKYNKATLAPEGYIEFDAITSGDLNAPYGLTDLPKRQSIAFRGGKIIGAYGGFFAAGGAVTPYGYNGIREFAADGQVLSESLYDPQKVIDRLSSLGHAATRCENEGVFISSDGAVYSLTVIDADSAGALLGGVLIFEESSSAPTAIDFSSATATQLPRPPSGIWYPVRAFGTSISNPLTGSAITTLTQLASYMFAVGLRECVFYTSHFAIQDFEGVALPTVQVVRVVNTNNALVFVDIEGNNGRRRLSWNGSIQANLSNRIARTDTTGFLVDTNGTGSPEGVITGAVGSRYMRTDGGAGTTLYVKESGTGNTGWVAK
jgi:hypothetical protein